MLMMDEKQCIEFLRRHQPMPADDDWDDDCEKLDEVRRFLTNNICVDAIPLLLNVFGEGNGYGVYQQVELAVRQYAPGDVVPHLLQGLRFDLSSVVYWNAQIAASFPDERLIDPLTELVHSSDPDIQATSITSIGCIRHPKVGAILESLQRLDLDDELRELVDDGLECQ